MSGAVAADKIQNNPKYHQLVKERDTLAWTLSALVCVLYYGFVLIVAYGGHFLTQPISSTSVIPIGIPIGVGVIVVSVILTGVYVRRANSHFDPMVEEIIAEATK